MVTAYNRREYLRYALASLLNQDSDHFETVLSKNFYDRYIDDLCSERGIRNVTTGSSGSGERVYDAIRSAGGDFILFLDDDDIFLRTKVSRVMEVLSAKAAGFYRNAIFPVTVDGVVARSYQPLLPDPLYLVPRRGSDVFLLDRYNCSFNSSSMGISRELLDSHASDLRKIDLAVDTFYFAVAASSGVPIFCDGRTESIYRIMPKSTSRDIRDFDSFVEFERSFLRRFVRDLERIHEIAEGSPAGPFLTRRLSLYRTLKYVFEGERPSGSPSIMDRIMFLSQRPFPFSILYSRAFRKAAMRYEFRMEAEKIHGRGR
ncbi:glycosyltransferase [Thermoplasma sp.]|uniref:glycosyltransferase n=1 Tax=Thermoplasma sp. TaxID=1973142 RepID=UPI0025E79DC3|nr:glycosyltransferase [Thermoplasma sp.]